MAAFQPSLRHLLNAGLFPSRRAPQCDRTARRSQDRWSWHNPLRLGPMIIDRGGEHIAPPVASAHASVATSTVVRWPIGKAPSPGNGVI